MCPASISDLPSEILEHILLSLPPVEIVKMKEVCRLFLDLIYTSQYLQYRIDLFGAGLVDNPNNTCGFSERRARLREYTDGWKDIESSVRYDYTLKSRAAALDSVPRGQGLFSAHLDGTTAISFLRLPSSPNQETVEEWTLELPFHFDSHVVCPQDNLLAVIEQGTGFVNIHLLSLLDGSPHEVPFRNVISLDLGHYRDPLVVNTQISGSRIALIIMASSFTMQRHDRELIAWDWETGEVVLEYSSGDTTIGRAISSITTMGFFEESWLLALCYEGPTPQLLVLNTLLPQQDPRSWRILGLPPLPAPRWYTQYKKTPTDYPEFSVDPAQRIFVVVSMDNRALITPVELLIQRMRAVRASPYIPLDEWMEGATVVHLHPNAHTLQLFDMKVLALCGSAHHPRVWGVQMFDLSKSGRRDIQLQQINEGGRGGCMRVLPAPKWFARCQVGDGIPRTTRFVGNKVVCFFYQPYVTDRPYFLRVLKIGLT